MQESPRIVGWNEPGAMAEIARVLGQGGVVALPTETLYGFSCLAHSQIGVRRILQLKGITARRGFLALAGTAEMVGRYLALEQDGRGFDFLRRVWPAPLSAVLRVREPLPWGETHAGVHTAAFRVPARADLLRLLRALGEPVVSTSVNRSGQTPLERPEEILREFGAGIDLLILDGRDPERFAAHHEKNEPRASSLADCTVWPPRSLRVGKFDLSAALQEWEAV